MQLVWQLGSCQMWKFGSETFWVFSIRTISRQVEISPPEMQWLGTQRACSTLAEMWQTIEITGYLDTPEPNWTATRQGVGNEPENEERPR